jgi:uncharacterized protein YprB with RNaseH-like and TPR domain
MTEWSVKEKELLEQYFKTAMSELTLYKKIFKINPDRTFKSISRKLEDMRLLEGRTRSAEKALSKLKIGYLDIEATNLAADFGFILCWFIKTEGKNEYKSGIITQKEILAGEFDKRVVTELIAAMKEYDILYAHYGSDFRFDIPFIRTRALKHGLESTLPLKNTVFIMDTYPTAKAKLKLHSNRLESLAVHLGVTNVKKTPLNSEHWMNGAVGDKDALAYIYLHNKRDVQLLERVHKRLKPVERPTYRSI